MTPSRTPLGFVRLAPGDPLSALGYGFQYDNPALADILGQLGAFHHKHDAHAAMVDPTAAATVALATTGGAIPASTAIHVAYTLTDGQGGESLPTTPIVVTTAAGYSTPASPPTVAVSYTAGTMLAGAPLYAVTITDGLGGETALGPAVSVTINPGHANAEVLVSGLTAVTNASSGSSTSAGWRLWRSVDGGSTWHMMVSGAYSTDTYTDSGASGGDTSVVPPRTGTTVGTNKLTVTVPSAGQPADATFFSIYADSSGQFLSPCLLGTYPVSDFGSAKAFTALTVANGSPPAVSRCYPGADKLDPSTDILDWSWKQTVADFAALPSVGNTAGDARVTLDTLSVYVWTGSAWELPPAGAPSGSAGGDLSGTFPNPGVAKLGGVAAAAYALKALAASQQSTTYAFALVDAFTVVESTSATAVTWTVLPHSSVALEVGAVIEVFQAGAGQVTIAAGSGVTLRSRGGLVNTNAQYSTIRLRQRATDEWALSGDLA